MTEEKDLHVKSPEAAMVSDNQPAVSASPSPAASAPATAKPAANTPLAQPKASALTKIGKEKDQKGRNTRFLLGCSFGFVILFILFVTLMVFVISRQGADSPVMRAFGLDPGRIKSFLLSFVSLSFGALALLFFVLLVVGIFRLLNAKKTDKFAKSRGEKMIFLSLIPLIFILTVWVFLYQFISQLEIAAEQVTPEIVVITPEDLLNLQAPVEITFSALNVAIALERSNVPIQGMRWDLDGNSEFETPVAAPEISRLYTRRGPVNVGLQVSVIGEATPRIYTKLIDIKEAAFSAEPSGGVAPLLVQFDASSLIDRGRKLKSIDWDFEDDGRYDETGPDKQRVRHTFDRIGNYSVHLRVIDENNVVENYYRTIEVKQSETPLLIPEITASPGLTGTAPLQIRFDGSRSQSLKGQIINYEWDFGDGSDLLSGRSVSHSFTKPGLYNVTLTVREDSGLEASTTVQVEITQLSSVPTSTIATTPIAASGVVTGELPLSVSFDGSKSYDPDQDIVDYEWDFESDGTLDATGQKTTKEFNTAGTYTVTLTVRDSREQEGKATVTIQVNEPSLKSVIKAEPQEGSAPLTVAFDGSSSSAFGGTIVSYEWDFGDGSPKSVTGAKITHKYNAIGTYTATLRLITNANEFATSSTTIFVREIPLRACFTPSRNNGVAPLSVSFDPQCSSGAVAKYSWNFGDGATSSAVKPVHSFESPGTYMVTLEVSDDKNNVDTYTDVIVVETP